MKRPLHIFISHFHKEGNIARAIKEELKRCFHSKVEVFLAEEIPYGKNWLNAIREELKDIDLMLTLFSPKSMNRPWINIESGYGIMKGIDVIPVCCLGLNKTELSDAYRYINSIDIEKENDIKRLLTESIAGRLEGKQLKNINCCVENWRENISKAIHLYLSYQTIEVRVESETRTFFHIVNKVNGKCVDVKAMSLENGTEVIGFPFQGNENQLWQFERIGVHSFLIKSKQTGKCLQTKEGKNNSPEFVQINDYKGEQQTTQQWTLIKLEDGAYKINLKASKLCLSMEKENRNDDPPILLREWGNGIEQRWWLQMQINPDLAH
jgi:hypothetical protein